MGLVDNERVGAVGQRVDLVEDVGELLQCCDDDPGLLADQGFGQLLRCSVDALDYADGVLELADGVLELSVQHDPVGDDHDLVEHFGVFVVVQR